MSDVQIIERIAPDAPVIVRVYTAGPRLGEREEIAAEFISAEECEAEWADAQWHAGRRESA